MSESLYSLPENEGQGFAKATNSGSSNVYPYTAMQLLTKPVHPNASASLDSNNMSSSSLFGQPGGYLAAQYPNRSADYNAAHPRSDFQSPISQSQPYGRGGARCRYCHTKMSSMLMLKLHEESIHGAVDRHRCSWCGFGCEREEELLKHILESHPQRPLSDLECILCRKRFKKKSYRNKHFSRCHFRDEAGKTTTTLDYRAKYQKCGKCDIWFRWVEDYRNHLQQCHPEKPHTAKTSFKQSEKSPKTAEESKEPTQSEEYSISPQTMIIEEGRMDQTDDWDSKAYMCCGCNIGFTTEEKLLSHARDAHE